MLQTVRVVRSIEMGYANTKAGREVFTYEEASLQQDLLFEGSISTMKLQVVPLRRVGLPAGPLRGMRR